MTDHVVATVVFKLIGLYEISLACVELDNATSLKFNEYSVENMFKVPKGSARIG